MDWLPVVDTLRWISLALWAVPALWLGPSAIGLYRRSQRQFDRHRTLSFFFAVLMIGFLLRWIAFPGTLPLMTSAELQFWAALYALSCALAVWTIMIARAYGRGERE